MPLKDILVFLDQACSLKKAGAVNHIRCSTRPDCLGQEVLDILEYYGLDMLELGVQSFQDDVLRASARGYSSDSALKACSLVKSRKFELGIQLMPGLPGSGPSQYLRDIKQTANIVPDVVRLYPCLVLKGTLLEEMLAKGRYRPWSLKSSIALLSRALLTLWQNGIQVIRTGLAPEPSLINSILAGPWHPALGSICRSEALKTYIAWNLAKAGKKVRQVYIPSRYASDFWGYKGRNSIFYARQEIARSMVTPWKKDYFQIFFAD